MCARLKVGQRVSGEGHVIGMRSRAARGGRYHLDPETRGIGVNIPGAFAEFVRVPAFNIVPLPDDVDDELGAILDPLGNAVHTALTFDLVGEDVLITGAGPIGIMAGGGGAPRRRAPRRHHRHQSAPPRARRRSRRRGAGRRRRSQDLREVMGRLKMTEGFDVGARDERRAGGLRPAVRHRSSPAAASRCSACRPSRRWSTGTRSSSSSSPSRASMGARCSRPGTR